MVENEKFKTKMIYAFWAMSTLKNQYQEKRHAINSHTYEYIRKLRAEEQKSFMGGRKRGSLTEETKLKISLALAGRKIGPQTEKHIASRFLNRKKTHANRGVKLGARPRCCCIRCKKEVDIVNIVRYHSDC